MNKSWFFVNALAAPDGGLRQQINIIGEIGAWGYGHADLLAQIDPAATVIDVSINSYGGELTEAIGIFNALLAHPAEITTRVDGVAASAASVIFLAGDRRIIPENGTLMVHSPWTRAAGNADQLRATADVLDKAEASLVATYAARTGQSIEALESLLTEEGTWLTPQEALAHGFATEVAPIARSAVKAMAQALAIPDGVLSRLLASELPQDQGPPQDKDQSPIPAEMVPFDEAGLTTLCQAAGMSAALPTLRSLAKAAGLDAVRALLAEMPAPSGINPTLSSGGEAPAADNLSPNKIYAARRRRYGAHQ